MPFIWSLVNLFESVHHKTENKIYKFIDIFDTLEYYPYFSDKLKEEIMSFLLC